MKWLKCLMTEVVKKTLNNNDIPSCENLHKHLLEYTKKNYTFEEFYSSMILRQFKNNCIIEPINTIVTK